MQGIFYSANEGIFSLRKTRYNDIPMKSIDQHKRRTKTQEGSYSSNKLTIKTIPILNSQNKSEVSYSKLQKLSEYTPSSLCITPEKKRISIKLSGENSLLPDLEPNVRFPNLKKSKLKNPKNTSELLELKSFRKFDKNSGQLNMCTVGTNTSNESIQGIEDPRKKIYIGKGYRKRLIQILDVFPVNSTPKLDNFHKNIKISRLKPKIQ